MTDRVGESRLIYQCKEGEVWDDEPGECPECDDPPHRLRKRRAVVCSSCTQAYFKRADFDKHECGDAL